MSGTRELLSDTAASETQLSDALIALHFQNDICDPRGLIPFSLHRGTGAAKRFLEASRRALEAARGAGWTIAHMHIVFAADQSDLPRNCRLFAKTHELGALKQGSWGAAAYDGFEPLDGEIFVTGTGNSAFRRTDLERLLRDRAVTRVNVMGLATQFSVEHTVRDAADMGYPVRLFADCCISGDLKAHRASLRTLAMLADIVDSTGVFEA
ncbi:MAG TPA: cysteine hydrolase [Xanthobacteraceae bacterium]|jgi:nicotinamidase-related amidase